MSTNPVKIGPTTLRCPVLIAPMSGVSDRPFRDLCHDLGAGLVVSEMIASEELVRERASVVRRATVGTARPFVTARRPRGRWMAEGARIAEASGAQIIDINMGCPAKRVTTGYSGSALMRDLDHASLSALSPAPCRPVTLKMRLGWDHANLNAAALASRAEAANEARHRPDAPAAILRGAADWARVGEIKRAVNSGDRQWRYQASAGAAAALAASAPTA
jgi:tRNA-dihydrouridine synthase